MALYKQSEFAALCGISPAALSVNKNRGKVVVVENMVDDTNPVNAEFLRRHLEKKQLGRIQTDYPAKDYPPTQQSRQIARPPREKILTDGFELSYNDLEKIKKQAEIKQIEQRTELLRKQNEKLAGESLPTDMVKSIFAQHFKSVTVSFKHSIERLLTDISKKKELSPEDQADIRGKLTQNLNTAIKEAIAESKRNIAHIANSIAVKREPEPVEEPE